MTSRQRHFVGELSNKKAEVYYWYCKNSILETIQLTGLFGVEQLPRIFFVKLYELNR